MNRALSVSVDINPAMDYHHGVGESVIYHGSYTPGALGISRVSVAGAGGAVIRVSLSGTHEAFVCSLAESFGQDGREVVEDPSRFADLFAAFERYFAGVPEGFGAIALAPEGTAFQQRVWAALRTVPWGSVVTYGELAVMAGRTGAGRSGAARATGGACGANPIPLIIPCHRVVRSGGGLGGYSGGDGVKQALLRLEGRSVSESGRVEVNAACEITA